MVCVKRTLPNTVALASNRLVDFEVDDCFDLHEIVGEGAYGVVCAARHTRHNMDVAIKKIRPFERAIFCLRTLREIKLLRFFNCENIISILDLQKPSSIDNFSEVYLIQELMETDMSRVIKSQTLTDDHCQYFLYQLLRGLKQLHTAGVLHRDLKPSNLLLNSNCDLKICDFGLARSISTAGDSNVGFMTEYVATRWYRAPEIMLTYNHYTMAIDIWSVGCILAEMLSGVPLFPGRDYADQLSLILQVLGTPVNEDFRCIRSDRARQYLGQLDRHQPRDFREMFPEANYLAVDLLSKMLTFNPQRRITVEQALEHPYLENYHDIWDEPSRKPLPKDFFDFENERDLSESRLKELIYEEVMKGGVFTNYFHSPEAGPLPHDETGSVVWPGRPQYVGPPGDDQTGDPDGGLGAGAQSQDTEMDDTPDPTTAVPHQYPLAVDATARSEDNDESMEPVTAVPEKGEGALASVQG